MERHGRRRWWATVAATSLVASGLGMGSAANASPVPASPATGDKIDAQLQEQLEESGKAEFWVRFEDRPDMAVFSEITDWNARGQAVYDSLTKTAQASQADMRADLDADGVAYEAFWATNSLRISGGDLALAEALSSAPGVEGLYPTVEITPPELEAGTEEMAPNAVEWGVADVNAPEVWDMGYTGEGIVVASIDTGVEWDHPALREKYRGYDPDTGDVDHDYSWFDASGSSPFPVDHNNHGTHVTGTMVGDDDGNNQIGVAPGARWIAANGCCPSDAALIASGQWMLAPTDVSKQNPRPDLRPHIINNSWGTQVPSNDPFMEDISEAWEAAGMFAVWANGNSGTWGCNSSGSPGSRIINYSVGNYNINHNLSPSSGRGYGQDGEIKPNISAPGSNVRSAVRGGGYASYNGTSMASPHVAGAVALLWGASEALKGDYDGTRAILNGSAIDTPDLTCGGTPENNNMFGQGRMDAQAMINQAPIGPTGRLEGTITSTETGEPIANATVIAAGEQDRSTVTNAAGEYSVRLAVGAYTVTAEAFGYGSQSAQVSVVEDQTVVQDFALTPSATGVVTGTVTDGGGYGFPLYARVVAVGTGVHTFTDPVTGRYELSLPEGATYTLRVEVQYPGYTQPSQEVAVSGDTTVDVVVPVNAETCTAPGYVIDPGEGGVFADFEGGLPEGWEVLDHQGNGQVWRFDDPGNRGNLTGGSGAFAIIDSDNYGIGNGQDTSLVTPSLDMSSTENPAVTFDMDYRPFTTDSATLRVSVDGGATWQDVREWTAAARGPREETVPLPMAAGQSDVRVAFHYEGNWDWWWQLDNVGIGSRDCVPAGEGGYVVGNVYDGNTGAGLVGATVTNLDHPEQTAMTIATPADPSLEDGFYWIFSDTPGANPFQAELSPYLSQVRDVTVVHADAVRADFQLGAGFVEVGPEEVEHTQPVDETRTTTLTFSNTGDGPAELTLTEVAGEVIAPQGLQSTTEVVTVEAETSFSQFGSAAELDAAASLAPSQSWSTVSPLPRVTMDNRSVHVDGFVYNLGGTSGSAAFADVHRYDIEGDAWTQVASLPSARSAVNAAEVGGQIVAAGGWADGGVTGQTVIYDPSQDAWSQGAVMPVPVSAAGVATVDGLVYVVGGCTTSDCTPMSNAVQVYDVEADAWTQLGAYPRAGAFPVCGDVLGELVCSGGNAGSGGTNATHVYDSSTDTWSTAPTAPVDHWASSAASANGQLVINGGVQGADVSNATYAFDGEAWTQLDAANQAVYRGGMACGLVKVGGSTAGFTPQQTTEHLPGWDECGEPVDVEWLTVEPMELTVEANSSATVAVTTDSTGLDLGSYTAGVRVRTSTPQPTFTIPVTMHVSAGTPDPDPEPIEVERWYGDDRYRTAARISSTYEPGVDVVYIATGLDYPDALAGSALAGSLGGPVLLTRKGSLPDATVQELRRLQPERVVVLGGPEAVEGTVLDAAGRIAGAPASRLWGGNRYGTAAAIARQFAGEGRVFVATGLDYPDALAAAARAGALDSPVLLVRRDSIPGATAAALDALQPTEITLLGESDVVTDDVMTGLEAWATVTRTGGGNRYQTSARIAAEYGDADVVFVASGRDWPDALAGSARAGADAAPLVLTRFRELPPAVVEQLRRLDADRYVVLGGYEALDDDIDEELRSLRD